MKQYKLFDLDIVDSDHIQVAEHLGSVVKNNRFYRVLTLNSIMIMSTITDINLKKWLKSSHLITADGQGIILGMKLLNNLNVKTCTGIDLVYLLLQKSYRFYFVGSSKDNIELAVQKVKRQFPNAMVCGYSHGYFSKDEEASILSDIQLTNPDFIFVGMGFPKQEYFIEQCSLICDRGIAIGIGGVFDVLSGVKKKAPSWVRYIKMEWFFRALQEPSKFLSFGQLFSYLFYILKIYVKKHFLRTKSFENV